MGGVEDFLEYLLKSVKLLWLLWLLLFFMGCFCLYVTYCQLYDLLLQNQVEFLFEARVQ